MPGNVDATEDYSNENIIFYNAIAQSYDSNLEQTKSNKIIRQKVAEKFCSVVRPGWMMDFGGGTGLDLKWLTENNYKVFFCEPSFGMRQEAINYNDNLLHNLNIVFLDSAKNDFKTWNNSRPFVEKLNGILSNFAVINNICELDLLFKNLASLLHTNGHLIALILHNNFQKNRLKKMISRIKFLVFQKPIKFYVQGEDKKQVVYIHSLSQIKKASKPYFDFCSADIFSKSGFVLIHLVKK